MPQEIISSRADLKRRLGGQPCRLKYRCSGFEGQPGLRVTSPSFHHGGDGIPKASKS